LKQVLLFLCILIGFFSNGQVLSEKDQLFKKFTYVDVVPEKLLSTRSIVLYKENLTEEELEVAQSSFQKTGIDAVAYLETDKVIAGPDPVKTFTIYLTSRTIDYLIFFEKSGKEYSLIFVKYNNTIKLVDDPASAWKISNQNLKELLLTIFRMAISNQKKQNMLINEFPETDIFLKYFTGRRNETFTNDARNFKIAIPKWGNEKDDEELAQILKDYFPVKYEMVDPSWDERELDRRGFITVLRFVHTRGIVAKEILGYDLSQLANSLTTVYYVNGEADLKTISANETIYKFYVKHIDYGNIFMGKGWDADITWQDALKNHLQAMRENLKF
jgi:hypothetical protein